jgi:hypothetical protein
MMALVLIISPRCDGDVAYALASDINYNNTGYEAYLGKYTVTCMGGVDVLNIEKVTLPLLRQVYPDSPIVFVYGGGGQERDYQIYLSSTYRVDRYAAIGSSDVEKGYALASFDHYVIQHEMAHLETCKIHRGPSDNIRDWVDAPNTNLPWCH